MMAVCVPSNTASSTTVTSNTALNCPASTVTDAGTVASPGFDEVSVTITSDACVAWRVTDPCPTSTPLPSVTEAGTVTSNGTGATVVG